MRKEPNIVITGTPGVGKTTHAELLAQSTGLKHVAVNQVVKDEGFHSGWDEVLGSWVVDEDKLLDYLEDLQTPGGLILDWHACDLYPERWIDLVVVIRCENDVLHDRLTARGYNKEKITQNIDSEIFEQLLLEAKESYDEDIVREFKSDGKVEGQVERNVEEIVEWVERWRVENGGHGGKGDRKD